MKIARIRHKLLLALAVSLSIGFIGTNYFYIHLVEKSILGEYQRTLHRLTDSIVVSITTIMTESHAEIMPEYAKRLKAMPGLIDFRILRVDGTEAYIDNQTIISVNKKLGEPAFQERKGTEIPSQSISPNSPGFLQTLNGAEAVSFIERDADGNNIVQFLDSIPNQQSCARCHDESTKVRGIIKVTASMTAIERDMAKARLEALIILATSLLVTMTVTGIMLGRSVAQPIENMTKAMAHVARGNFDMSVTTPRQDEVGKMAVSFNLMTEGIRSTHGNMLQEREKLNLVIQGSGEAVIVTNSDGKVVLANAAAEELLEKPSEQIIADGIYAILDDPEIMGRLLDAEVRQGPIAVDYKDRRLLVSASTILDDQGESIGSAALLRDISAEYRLLKELERLSTTDALTDVYNRRHLDNTLKKELDRAKQSGGQVALVMFDADHFKSFNDTYGHDQGDRVLKAVGVQMKQAIRTYDTPCRYGGEEFMIILPSTDCHGALIVAERLRTNIEAMRVDGLKVTVSLGISSYPEIPATAPEDLILAADSALYESKEGGRNRTTIFVPKTDKAG